MTARTWVARSAAGMAAGVVALAPILAAPSTAAGATPAATAPATASAGGGHVAGFSTGDFVYLNLLNTTQTDLAQVSISQSAAAVASGKLRTADSLHQLLMSKPTANKSAYGHASGVSLNLGQGANTVPQAQLTTADATSPPRSATSTNLVTVPAAPLATATVQPDVAAANTRSRQNFCVLGKPLSTGTADVTDASVLPADQVATGFALLQANGEVLDASQQELVPNGGAGTFGLSASSSLQTAGLTLFKGVPGAETTIKVINPVTLDAIAGGRPGSAKVTFGDAKGETPVLSISNGSTTQVLTLDQLIGGGVKIDFDGLIKVDIGLKPTTKLAADGTSASATADLVRVQVVGNPSASSGSVGGPLGPVLTPVLGPVLDALDNSGLLQQIDQALTAAGVTTATDLRVGHFEAAAQVPTGGIRCGLPVHKTVDKDVVHPGDRFTYTITVSDPYDCTLRHVRVDDRITADEGVLWDVVSTTPTADTSTTSHVGWNDIGTVRPHQHRSVQVGVVIKQASGVGRFTDHAAATATCGTGSSNGGTDVTLTGHDTLTAPRVAGKPLADTGSSPWIAAVAALLIGAGLLTRRLVRGR